MLYLPLTVICTFASLYFSYAMTRGSSIILFMFLLLQLVYQSITILTFYNSKYLLDNTQYYLLMGQTVMQCLFSLGYLGYSRVLLKEFGWKEYKIQGADKESLDLSRIFEFFIGLSYLSFVIYFIYFLVVVVVAMDFGQEYYSALLLFVVLVLMGNFFGVYGVSIISDAISFSLSHKTLAVFANNR
jgi:hypothetical protein